MHLVTTTDGRAIVAVQVTNCGSDQGQLEPMVEAIAQRTGTRPTEYLVDGGFVKLESITAAAAQGVTVYAPVPEPRTAGIDRYAPKPDDSPAGAGWRRRMGTESAKRIYVQRGAVAERTNVDLRGHRRLDRLNVRGLVKVKSVVLLAALTFNLLRMISEGVSL